MAKPLLPDATFITLPQPSQEVMEYLRTLARAFRPTPV